MEREEKYCIIKELLMPNGKKQNVIILDGGSEVLEFNSYEKAEYMASVFEFNSDSGYKYRVRKIS
tara:strand:- start:341 stop:535 length:195 start_codon:yes stop_codon:yes gene_type:complete